MSAATVRTAGTTDVDALGALRRQWVEEQGATGPDPGFADRFDAWFKDEMRQRTFWIAEIAGAPVGMVNLLTFTRMPTPGRSAGAWGYLGNMYVTPERRNEGIGGLLLTALLAHADAAGLERVVLSPTERSVPFYRRAGFDAADQLLLRPRP